MFGYQYMRPRSAAFAAAGDATLVFHQDLTQTSLAAAAVVGPTLSFARATSATYFDSAGVLQTAASGAARLAAHLYNGSSWENKGYLAEGPGENICLQSEDLTTTWTNPGGNTTITANAGAAPDGNTTADDVLHGDSAETVQQTITVTDNTVVTISAFVKQGTTGSHDWVKMSWLDESDGDNGFEAWFDLSTGNVGTAQATGTGSYTASSARMEDVAGGWYRISAAGQIVSGQTDGRFEIINTTADAVDTAEATNSVWWWGLQVEESPIRTSYIATTTTSVTRNKDVLKTTDMTWLSTEKFTCFADVHQQFNTTFNDYIVYIERDAAGNLFQFYNRTDDILVSWWDNASGNDALLTAGALPENTAIKVAFAKELDDAAHYINGSLAGTDPTVGESAEVAVEINIGIRDSGSNFEFKGFIKTVKIYNVRKSNAELATETT